MTYFPVQPRYSVYIDSLGDPLDDGYIYLGKANLDPTVYPAKASWDEAGLYPITFPVRTMNGYPLRDGIPAQMYLNFADNTEYSVLINDEDGVEVFSSTTGLIGYFPSTGAGGDAATLNGLASDTAATADTIAARDSSGDIAANAFESTVATGTAPLTVASTTVVSNLNADMVDGVQASNLAKLGTTNIFTNRQDIEYTSPSLRLRETDTTTQSVLNQDGGRLYIQVSSTSYTGSGNLYISGTGSVDINEFKVRYGGAWNDVYHAGISSASDTFTTADAKTVTVVNGLITSIV